jgi:hypothetical protein
MFSGRIWNVWADIIACFFVWCGVSLMLFITILWIVVSFCGIFIVRFRLWLIFFIYGRQRDIDVLLTRLLLIILRILVSMMIWSDVSNIVTATETLIRNTRLSGSIKFSMRTTTVTKVPPHLRIRLQIQISYPTRMQTYGTLAQNQIAMSRRSTKIHIYTVAVTSDQIIILTRIRRMISSKRVRRTSISLWRP